MTPNQHTTDATNRAGRLRRVIGWLERALVPAKPRKPPTRFQRLLGRAFLLLLLVILVLFLGWRWKLKRDVAELIATYRSEGLPTSGKELNAFYPAVPDKDNAALLLLEAAGLCATHPNEQADELQRFNDFPGRTELLTSADLDLLSDHLALNSDAISKCVEALALPESRYPVDLSDSFDANLSHLAEVKQLQRLMQHRCLIALASSDTGGAADSIEQLIRLAETLDEEPIMISYMVRAAIFKSAVAACERTLNFAQLDAGTLALLAGSFKRVNQSNTFARAMAGEVAMASSFLSLEKPDLLVEAKTEDGDSTRSARATVTILRWTGLFERDLRFYLQGMRTNLTLAKLPPPRSLAMTNTLPEMSRESAAHYHVFATMALLGQSIAASREAEHIARLTLVKSALAIEHFRLAEGRLPESLAELVPEGVDLVAIDPFDGRPLRYRKLDRGYLLYSTGKDGADDGGREPPRRIKSTDTNSYDLTFVVER